MTQIFFSSHSNGHAGRDRMFVLYCVIFMEKTFKKMEDKENVKRSIATTKIPVPVHPLPPVSNHVLNKTYIGKRGAQRCPLKTLSQSNTSNPCSSSSQEPKSQKTLVTEELRTIDTRHITVRQRRYEPLSVSKLLDDTIIISDDDSEEEEKKVNVAINNSQICCETCLTVTPAIQSAEPRAVKNIKRSLMRPHSRELQGISPVAPQDICEEIKVKRVLQFGSQSQEISPSQDYWIKSYMTCMTRDYTDDVFFYLQAVEKNLQDFPKSPSKTRACVINWLIKINGVNGNPATTQTACCFFDIILSIEQVPLNKLQLVAAACYWLAQKLNDCATTAAVVVKYSGNAFTVKELLAAEKNVWRRLKFPRQPVVPQEFITYLSWWCNPSNPDEIKKAATFLCMTGIMIDKKLCDKFPSVIAAAAVWEAVKLLGKTELLTHLQLCPVYKEAEKKASSLCFVSFVLRRAVCIISSTDYEYTTLLEYYGKTAYDIVGAVFNSVAERN